MSSSAFEPQYGGALQRPASCPPQRVPPVPPLREDLKLFPAAPNQDGSPAWMIQDPVTNRFFRIGWLEFELLSRWHLGNPALILLSLRRETPLKVGVENIESLTEFLLQQNLIRASSKELSDKLLAQQKKQTENKLNWLLHNYLFFRLPLVRPAGFLQATYPWVRMFYTRAFLWLTVLVTITGLFLVARQWDSFVNTFVDFLSLKGLAGFAVALIFAKCLHELGHAYTATRYGVRVAHMGLAFLVLWPMLYTDTSESWKLTRRQERFSIAAAGIVSELALAGFATFAWAVMDDGALRSALFFLATASWVMTLAINASPFMRFDGYFLLMDALDMPNLHQRSGAFARTWMRRNLLGWDEPWPEPASPPQRRALIGFAWATWLYRLVLFLGIAAAVYYFFFKALGIFLFVVEIAWFIVRPIWSETKVWHQQRKRTSRKAKLGWLIGLGAILAILFIPWRNDIHAPGLLRSDQQTLIYSPLPARVAQIRQAGAVKAGEVLAELDSPDARSRAMQSAAVAQALALALDQTIGRSDGMESRALIQEQLGERLAEVQAQRNELSRLVLRAPYDGVLLDTDHFVAPGVWINGSQPIGVLIDPTQWVAEVLVEQSDLSRVRPGSEAKFFWRGQADAPLRGKVISIDSTRSQSLPHAMLAAEHGGAIAASRGATETAVGAEAKGTGLIPRDSLYRVRIRFDAQTTGSSSVQRSPSVHQRLAQQKVQAGTAVIQGEPRSIGMDWLRSAAAVLVRESGF